MPGAGWSLATPRSSGTGKGAGPLSPLSRRWLVRAVGCGSFSAGCEALVAPLALRPALAPDVRAAGAAAADLVDVARVVYVGAILGEPDGDGLRPGAERIGGRIVALDERGVTPNCSEVGDHLVASGAQGGPISVG